MSRASASFDLLDERVRRWIWRQGWTSLKDIQENAIPAVLAGNSDVIISASTAGGKTEAAFLPILTSILQNGKSIGYQVLYVSPLKALINDQYRRLADMTSNRCRPKNTVAEKSKRHSDYYTRITRIILDKPREICDGGFFIPAICGH